jgi:hypothetical protein
MKAIRYDRYGPPDVLSLQEIDLPALTDSDVLVRVKAAAVNDLMIDTVENRSLARAGGSSLAPGLSWVSADRKRVVCGSEPCSVQ